MTIATSTEYLVELPTEQQAERCEKSVITTVCS